MAGADMFVLRMCNRGHLRMESTLFLLSSGAGGLHSEAEMIRYLD